MDKKLNLAIGGQALIEGVMIRSPHHIVMSVRVPDGSIETVDRKYTPLSKRHKGLNVPIVRGILNFVEMIGIGMQAINWSSKRALNETPEKESAAGNAVMLVLSVLLSLGLVLFLFKYIPLVITNYLDAHSAYIRSHWIVFNLIEGSIKILLFFAYVWAISQFKDIRRVFQYHGAEHKSIFAYEHDASLTPDGVRPYQKEHPRCGTSFILIVFTLSILVYTLVPRFPLFWQNFGIRIALLPLIAGLAYEILKLAGKYQNSRLMHAVSLPGLWFQYITTREPDTQQLEVAIRTITRALELENNQPATHEKYRDS